MAPVTIDLSPGKRATLSERRVLGVLTLQQRRDADEFLRKWPPPSAGGGVHSARGYIVELGLHVAFSPPGAKPGDAVATLKAAVKTGRVAVTIESAVARSGGGGAAPQPSPPRLAAAGPSFRPFAALADDAGASMAVPLGGAGGGAGLLGIVEQVASSVFSSVEGNTLLTDNNTGTSALLNDAAPFNYSEDLPGDDFFSLAAKTPNTGDPNTWFVNPGSGQTRYYGADGLPAVDLDFDHPHAGMSPHAHNWDGGVRGVAVPFSPWP